MDVPLSFISGDLFGLLDHKAPEFLQNEVIMIRGWVEYGRYWSGYPNLHEFRVKFSSSRVISMLQEANLSRNPPQAGK